MDKRTRVQELYEQELGAFQRPPAERRPFNQNNKQTGTPPFD